MIDRFLDFLKRLPSTDKRADTSDADDPRVASAALLTHIMDADGERTTGESAMLRTLLSDTFNIEGAELDRVMRAGEEADKDAVDLYAFTSILDRHLDRDGRLEFISIMWDMVYSDGILHELEDNLVWRVAELIHVEGEQRVALRRRARDNAGLSNDGVDLK